MTPAIRDSYMRTAKRKRRRTRAESARLIKLKRALDMSDSMNDDFVELVLERVAEAHGRGVTNLAILEAIANLRRTT